MKKRYKTRLVDPEKLKYGAVGWAVGGAVVMTHANPEFYAKPVYGAVGGAVSRAVRGGVTIR